jgi:hypothetical protein
MPKLRTLKLRELLKKLKPFGILALSKKQRGKGSEIILFRPENPGSKKGPQFPLKDHGGGTEIYKPVIKAIIRRFNLPDDFLD